MTLTAINNQLGLKGTDKGDKAHTHGGRSNLTIYEGFFYPFRNLDFDLLEIGVRDGGSFRLWERYFTRARIHGIDVMPSCQSLTNHRTSIVIGSQSDPGVLQKTIYSCNDLRIVVDDGSHYLPFMMASFKSLWPILKSGGIYVFEDSAITRHGVDLDWVGMRLNTEPMPLVPRLEFDQLILKSIEDMDHRTGTVLSLHAYYNLVILEKL